MIAGSFVHRQDAYATTEQMLAKFVSSRGLLQTSLVLLALLNCENRCFSQEFSFQSNDLNGVQSYQLSYITKNRGSIDILFGDVGSVRIRALARKSSWDIETEEGKKKLSAYLDSRAQRYVEELATKRPLTPEQLVKLTAAAKIQVARDCRSVQQLVSASVKAIRDNPNFGPLQLLNDQLGLIRNSSQLGDLFEGGIGRDNSLFNKVLHTLK